MLKFPSVCLEICFLTYLLWGQCRPVPTVFSTDKPISLSSRKYFEQRTEMKFHRRLANITGLICRSLYCPQPTTL